MEGMSRVLVRFATLCGIVAVLAAMAISSCDGASSSRVSVRLGAPGADGTFGYSYGLSSPGQDSPLDQQQSYGVHQQQVTYGSTQRQQDGSGRTGRLLGGRRRNSNKGRERADDESSKKRIGGWFYDSYGPHDNAIDAEPFRYLQYSYPHLSISFFFFFVHTMVRQ
jgi:hypothetical protein